ncbi:hypothetical protein SAR11G3_00802 [Candidatus Pelagibacter sp. IMCC9063]|uniref:hypothetical protein n=1 Tax=Pelagibacter sp. (strain IMCC9063) TaxID=1002672 RepID=UPI00020465D1|nr:hypothetical protein [Candidatus Pelagibacter sp. IMCC9063]AEA81277.1 hypothetical protein SAR11G3_00802 [Candidatus Pelagibacter sp. IMCC9063]
MKGSNTTEILSKFSANLTFEDIPKKVLEHIKLLFFRWSRLLHPWKYIAVD